MEDAIALFRQAIDLRPGPSHEVQLWRSIGRAQALRYDGKGMWDAMQQAIQLCEEPSLLGELYAELAVETASRSGMWAHVPDVELVQGWIDRGLELSESGSAARARALIALCFWNPERPSWAVDELDGLTRALGDPRLRILALEAAWLREFASRRYPVVLDLVLQAYEVEAGLTDPTIKSELREASISLFTLCGRPEETRRLLAEYDVLSEGLSPHHRMHGVAMAVELEEVTGDWEAIRALIPRTRAAVADNLATPCVRNSRSLLVAAAACAALGDDAESRSLEAEAEGLGAEGYEDILAAPRIRLALNRGDLDMVRDLMTQPRIPRLRLWYHMAAVTSYLDALGALGDAARAEADAPQFLEPPSAMSPFALRALGTVRGDGSLLEEAARRFESQGFERQARYTRSAAPG